MQTFSDQQDIFATIQQHILNPRGTLYHEPQLLLMEELREPRNYFAILRAIAEGRRRLNEIARLAGINDARAASRFLDILRQLHVITREIQVTERQPTKSRKGIYQEIDLVAINEADKTLLVGECKWTQRPVGTNILADLQRKAQRLIGSEAGWQLQFALFAKSGFTPDLQQLAADQGVLLATPAQLVQELS
ncbi:MAG: DUF234 domain-containing protein [Caldilineaceae bacterium]